MSKNSQVILHLTDLHFNANEDEAAQAARALILGALVQSVLSAGPEWQPTIVCISGDLGYYATEEDFVLAANWIKDLLQRLGLDPKDLVLCAGNHDLERSSTGFPRPGGAKEADKALRTPLPPELAAPFANYESFCADLKAEPLTLGSGSSRLVGFRQQKGIQFICLNSSWYCRDEQDKGNLWIGLPFLHILSNQKALDGRRKGASYPVICLVHHPREWLHESDQTSYVGRVNPVDYLAERVDLILTGHTHGAPSKANQLCQGAWHLTGGATYADETYDNNYRLIRVEPDCFRYRTFSYIASQTEHNWAEPFPEQRLSLSDSSSVPEVNLADSLATLRKAMADLGTDYELTVTAKSSGPVSVQVSPRSMEASNKLQVQFPADAKELVDLHVETGAPVEIPRAKVTLPEELASLVGKLELEGVAKIPTRPDPNSNLNLRIYSRGAEGPDESMTLTLACIQKGTVARTYAYDSGHRIKVVFDFTKKQVDAQFTLSWDEVEAEESLAVLQISRRMQMKEGQLIFEEAHSGEVLFCQNLESHTYEIEDDQETLEQLIEHTKKILQVNRRFGKKLRWPPRAVPGEEIRTLYFLAQLASGPIIVEHFMNAQIPLGPETARNLLTAFRADKPIHLSFSPKQRVKLELWGQEFDLGLVMSVMPKVILTEEERQRVEAALAAGEENLVIEVLPWEQTPSVHLYVDLMTPYEKENLPPEVEKMIKPEPPNE